MKQVVLAFASLALAALASALEPVNVTKHGVAIDGYDPVAYFVEGRPVAGSAGLEVEWRGATWRFATPANRDRFLADPETHAPRYGGYCAYAVSEGRTAPIDPTQWSVIDGRLYLNYSARIKRTWEKDIPGRIARADEHWPRLLERPAQN